MTPRLARPRHRSDDEEEPPFRPTRRFTKPKPRDTRRFKPGWFELVLDLLRSYASKTGHSAVPRKHKQGNFDLGRMVVYLRERYRQAELSAERIRTLERFPGWSWDPIQDSFERGLSLLRRFALREGHAFVVASHHEDGFPLGRWVERRRSQSHEGSLSRQHAQALEAVPGWAWRSAEARRREVLRLPREFARKEGHTLVPRGYRRLGCDLGGWVFEQRHRHRAGELPSDRIRALEKVPGWSWDPIEDRFQLALRLLRRFARLHGHCRVPQRHVESGFRLGAWLSKLRSRHKSGKLPRQRATQLQALPGWTWQARDTPRARQRLR